MTKPKIPGQGHAGVGAQTAPKAPAIAGATPKAARTVTVACKIPNGLVLQLCRSRESSEQTMAGSRVVKVFDKIGPAITVAGPAYPAGQVPKGFKKKPDDASNMALTYKVPAEFWDEWVKQNKDADYVQSGMIFAFADVASVEDRAEELVKVMSGFEPVNPEGDPRVPRPMTSQVEGVKTAEEWRGTFAS